MVVIVAAIIVIGLSRDSVVGFESTTYWSGATILYLSATQAQCGLVILGQDLIISKFCCGIHFGSVELTLFKLCLDGVKQENLPFTIGLGYKRRELVNLFSFLNRFKLMTKMC